MRTFIGYRIIIVIVATSLFITTFGTIPVFANGYDDAKKDAEKKAAKAAPLVKECNELRAKAAAAKKKADDLRKAADKARDAADKAPKSEGGFLSDPATDKAAADAEDAADAAAKAADDAKDAADRNPNDKKAQKDAVDKEAAAGTAVAAADRLNDPAGMGGMFGSKRPRAAARDAERAARAAARAAAAAQALAEKEEPCGKADKAQAEADKAIKKFEDMLKEKIKRTGGSSETKDDSKEVEEMKKKVHPPVEDAPKPADPPKQKSLIPPVPPNVVTGNGLQTMTFDTIAGTVTVNLPDDIRAGDTISGTVFTEPKGNTPDEKAANQKALEGYVIDLGDKQIRMTGEGPRFIWTPPVVVNPTPPRYKLRIVEVLGGPAQTGVDIPVLPNPTPSGAVIIPDPKAPPTFKIPELGQTGRPITITGPFDGNVANTGITARLMPPVTSAPAPVNLTVLAGSPRQATIKSPVNITGPIQITINAGNTISTVNYRNVGINLSAPNTNLLKDQKTTLTVQVIGLLGLSQPVNITLASSGVITMQGGASQQITVLPSQVGSGGIFTTTREITGVQAGGWSANATVITAGPR